MPIHLFAAGSNAKGQLATGDDEDAHTFLPCLFSGCRPDNLPTDTEAILDIASGGNHTLALLARRSSEATSSSSTFTELWGAGDGSKGQLGPSYGETGNTMSFRPLDLPLKEYGLEGYSIRRVAACWETSYVVVGKEGCSDVVVSMGGNDYGDLGVGENVADSADALHVVDFTSIVGCSQKVAVRDIDAGPHHVIVLLNANLDDGTKRQHLVGWGASRHGQLGSLSSSSGRPLAFSPTPLEIHLDDVLHDPVLSIALGNQHSVFLRASGRVSALGSNKKGQVRGLGSFTDVTHVDCTWNGAYILSNCPESSSPCLMSVGTYSKGQLGRHIEETGDKSIALAGPRPVEFPPSFKDRSLLRFACGSEYVLALTSSSASNEVWGWGWNEHGNLGIGSLDDVRLPVKVWPPSGLDGENGTAVGVWAGCGTSFIAVNREEGSGDDR